MDLAEWLLDRADADDSVGENVKLTVLAALAGDDALDEALGGSYAAPASGALADAKVAPVAAFLKSVKVAGFRGIGREAVLAFNPAPGLVVVAGRNGSGKSTFAEGLELAITGGSYRGQKKASLLRDTWRNLHEGSPCHVDVEITAEGRPVTRIVVEWSPDAGFDDRQTWVQTKGAKKQSGVDSLGWREAVELYRPLLPYEELGAMLEETPTRLHDALEAFLGLDQLTDAGKRIAERVKGLREPVRRAKSQLADVKPRLEGLDDVRAVDALGEVKKRAPDLDAVRTLIAAGSQAADPVLACLTNLARVQVTNVDIALAAADGLEAAVTTRAAVDADVSASSLARDELLERALGLHTRDGDGPCPVCGVGHLDAQWVEQANAQLAAHTEIRTRLAEAERGLMVARRAAEAMLGPALDLDDGGAELPGIEAAESAMLAWRALPAGDTARVDHIRSAYPAYADAVAALALEAEKERAAREDRWGSVVPALASWLETASEVASQAATLATAESADKWIKANLADLRNERLAPLADRARAIWAQLRQESNVDLGSIRLEGAATRRRVDLRARVDDADAGALAVMSQGELNALALALFIPRAAADESPFGFLVLDDPVQAMDPSKIDGFLQVLGDLAQTRQVIVFTHDDRLPESLRRSHISGRILEVSRDVASRVHVQTGLDPAQRYLDDAYAVANDDGLTADDKARIIPGLCRFAVEALCRDGFFGREFSTGRPRVEVEHEWQSAKQTRDRLRLLINTELDTWLTRKPWRKQGLGICTSAQHTGLKTDPSDAVRTVMKMADELRKLA